MSEICQPRKAFPTTEKVAFSVASPLRSPDSRTAHREEAVLSAVAHTSRTHSMGEKRKRSFRHMHKRLEPQLVKKQPRNWLKGERLSSVGDFTMVGGGRPPPGIGALTSAGSLYERGFGVSEPRGWCSLMSPVALPSPSQEPPRRVLAPEMTHYKPAAFPERKCETLNHTQDLSTYMRPFSRSCER